MQFNSDVWAWLYESYRRLSLKSPHYFQVVQAIGMIAALISGIPLAIQQFELFTGLHVTLPFPDVVNSTFIRVVFFCGLITKVLGKLPVTDPNKPVDGKTGDAQPRQMVMPYSVKKAETPTIPPENPLTAA